MLDAVLTQVPRFDGVNRLPFATVPHGFTRAEWISRLGTLVEQVDEPRAEQLRRWRADLEATDERMEAVLR